MKILRVGISGEEVEQWQIFLLGQAYDIEEVDGVFGEKTEQETKKFQKDCGITDDGVVGSSTIGKAALKGFAWGKKENEFPPVPSLKPLVSNSDRMRTYGRFSFTPKPINGNQESIIVDPSWISQNIVYTHIPQLSGVKGFPKSCKIPFHKAGSEKLIILFKRIEEAGLLNRVLTWDGSFVPRFVRGSKTYLSNHAWGSAFDINAKWNPLGSKPAPKGSEGSVIELVSIANDSGFYWGAHFSGRPDGMHFELAAPLIGYPRQVLRGCFLYL